MSTGGGLFTVGYEAADVSRFIATLSAHGVSTVVDVRAIPLSRKKGFSKAALSAALSDAGMGYLHMQALGCPKPIRDRYRIDKDWAAYKRDFLTYLDSQVSALCELAQLSGRETICLVCFEADPRSCHRRFVARAAERLGAPASLHLRTW